MEARVTRLEEDVRAIKESQVRLETLFTATLPHLATKADVMECKVEIAGFKVELADLRTDLAEKPSKTYMWGILGVLLTAYACGLAALSILK
jgi:hypothetical protein